MNRMKLGKKSQRKKNEFLILIFISSVLVLAPIFAITPSIQEIQLSMDSDPIDPFGTEFTPNNEVGEELSRNMLNLEQEIASEPLTQQVNQMDWSIETIDQGGSDVGLYTSIVLDSNNHPHISYFDRTSGALKYAKYTGTQWEIETIETIDYATYYGYAVTFYSSIALDSNDYPHISYNEGFTSYGSLKYAKWTGNEWSIETVDSWGSSGFGEFSSLAIDSTDKPHISYKGNGWEVRYAHWTGSTWDIESIYPGPQTVGSTSLTLDSVDNPYIVYIDSYNEKLLYCNKISGEWTVESVESSLGSVWDTSFDLDGEDNPHITISSYTISSDTSIQYDYKYLTLTNDVWNSDSIDTDSNIKVIEHSLKLDSNNNPHVSYSVQDTTNFDSAIKYATFRNGQWQVEYLDTESDYFGYPSIALNTNDYPSICYLIDNELVERTLGTNYDLKYAIWSGNQWNSEIADAGQGKVGKYSSIAIDGNDERHISYYDEGYGDLRYAFSSNDNWEVSVVEERAISPLNPIYSNDDVGLYTSIALDSNERPHIGYHIGFDNSFNGYNNKLRYAQMLEAEWNIETVEEYVGESGLYWLGVSTSLALDQYDNVHISTWDSLDLGTYEHLDLVYAKWDGSEWQIEVVDSEGNVGSSSSLVLDSNDNPHISYSDGTNYDLKYARWTGIEWLIETVDSEGDVGSWTSIALDSTDHPCISYYDSTNHDLKYARWTGTEWLIETVDSDSSVGAWTSLALDSNDNPHISYYDGYYGGNSDLKYAKWTGTEWYIETVDSDGAVGLYTSIALDSNDNPHISYYDASNGDLKIASGTLRDIPSTPIEPDMHRTYGDAEYQVGISITVVSTGGFALLGYTRTSATSDYDFWLIRTDFGGEVLWDKTFDRTTRDYANKIIETSDGGFAMLGTTDSDDGTTRVTWLVRTDSNGDVLWDQVYDGPGATADEAFGLVEIEDGGFAFAGRARNLGLGDAWVVRTDPSGAVVWSRTYGGLLRDEGYEIILADDGNLVVAGYTDSYGAGLADAWLLKLDVATGNEVWAKTIGESAYEVARSVTRSSNGDFILCGSTGVGAGASGSSIWLARTDPDGDLIWHQEYTVEGTGHSTAVSVIETSRSNFAVTGYVGDNLLWLRTDSDGNLVTVNVFGGPSRDTGSQVIEFAPDSFAIIGYTRSFSVGTSEDVWLIIIAPPNSAPVASAGGPILVNEGTEAVFDASGTSDPDGDELMYRWNIDGEWTEWSSSPIAIYTWYDDHSETGILEVSDGLLSDTDSVDVTVSNVAPTGWIDSIVQPTFDFILPGDVLTFNGNYFDPGTLDTHTLDWAFGDGESAQGMSVDHSYSSAGTFVATLTVTDDDGGFDTASALVIVGTGQDAAGVIISHVENLVDSGVLKSGAGSSLRRKLVSAIDLMDSGNTHAASQKLGDFIDQVNALIRAGRLSVKEGEKLIALAQEIIHFLMDS
ncbi:MAG: PKD domain-containing protein [Promethearchaeota archaeon]